MAQVTLTDVQRDLSYLLGEQTTPTSGIDDRTRFIQAALERAYRAYDFPMNRVTATVQAVAGVATLPSNVLQDSGLDVRVVYPGKNDDQIYKQIEYSEIDSFGPGDYRYYVDGYAGTYVLKTTETSTSPILTVRYSLGVPTLNASIATPFPSSMALARGALIYYRQAEDPQADIGQEEALFQGELEEIIAAYNRKRPQRRVRSRHEVAGTYIGDITYLD